MIFAWTSRHHLKNMCLRTSGHGSEEGRRYVRSTKNYAPGTVTEHLAWELYTSREEEEFAERMGIQLNFDAELQYLTQDEKDFLFYGRYGGEIDVNQKSKSRFGWKFRPRGWEGIINLLRRRYAQTESD